MLRECRLTALSRELVGPVLRLRITLRLSARLGLLGHKGHDGLSRGLDEIGRMLGADVATRASPWPAAPRPITSRIARGWSSGSVVLPVSERPMRVTHPNAACSRARATEEETMKRLVRVWRRSTPVLVLGVLSGVVLLSGGGVA